MKSKDNATDKDNKRCIKENTDDLVNLNGEQIPLKGFFKSGENSVPHLSYKEKILARLLEKNAHQGDD